MTLIPKINKRSPREMRERYPDPYEALAQIDFSTRNESRRTRIETRVAYLVALVIAGVVAFALDGVEDLRKGRINDQAITNQVICERQEAVLTRLVDTKFRIVDTNTAARQNAIILSRLVRAVAPDAEPANRPRLLAAAAELEKNASNLREENRALRRGIAILELELERVDCGQLPANKPFEGI